MERSTKWNIGLTIFSFSASAALASMRTFVDQANYPFFVAFILSFVILSTLSIQIIIHIRRTELKERHDKLEKIVAEKNGLRHIGSIEQFNVEIAERLLQTKSVENTSIYPSNLKKTVNYYQEIHQQEIVKTISGYINNGCKWTEIYSSDGRARAQLVYYAIKNKSLFVRYCSQLNAPIMNFIIFEYKDNTKEVYFGFAAHAYEETNVYSSNNINIVSHYHQFFKALIDNYSTVDDRVGGNINEIR